MKSKFGDLVMDVGESALRILLMNHVMERKFIDVEKKCKDATADVGKWKHKVDGLHARLNEPLEAKDKAEKAVMSLETKLESSSAEKEAVELERDSFREKCAQLEEDVEKCKGALAEYFDDGFERAYEQAQHFHPKADFSGLDAFEIIKDGELVDEQ